MAVFYLKSNILLVKSEALISLFCFKKPQICDSTRCECLLLVVNFAHFFNTLQALYLLNIAHQPECDFFLSFFCCTQFQMSALVVIAEMVMHVSCIKHTSKHHSTRYSEASVFEILCCHFSLSAVMGKWMKTLYFFVQDFSILRSITCRGRGQGDKKISFLKNGEFLLNALVAQNWSHWKYNTQTQG